MSIALLDSIQLDGGRRGVFGANFHAVVSSVFLFDAVRGGVAGFQFHGQRVFY